MQMGNDIYKECVERFQQVLRRDRQFTREDSVEQKVVHYMVNEEKVGDHIGKSPEERAENMKKSESQRNLLLDTDGDNIDLSNQLCKEPLEQTGSTKALDQSGSSAELARPPANINIPVALPKSSISTHPGDDSTIVYQQRVIGQNPPEVPPNHNPCLSFQQLEQSTSGYSTGDGSLVSLSPADPTALQDSSPPRERPSFLNLPDPLSGRSGQEPTSKEGSTSPMQTSPPEKMLSDEDSTDNLK